MREAAARSNYGTGDSLYKTISAAGVSQRYSSCIRETDENGKEVIIPTINAGTVTVDLDKNNFDPLENTPSSATNIDYYPRFYMLGTGTGVYNENYGEFLFTPNTQDKSNKVRLEISPCGGLFKYQWSANISNCRNYVDISVDTSAAEGGLRELTVYGIGRTDPKVSHCENRGDITVKECTSATVLGKDYKATEVGGSEVYTGEFFVSGIGGTNADNCINFGDISVSGALQYRAGGICDVVYSTAVSDCYNYGNVTCTDSGGRAYVGGIAACLVDGKATRSVKECYNFGKVSIINPNSYIKFKISPTIYLGGICGYADGSGGVSECVNFCEVIYNNEKGENTSGGYDNTGKMHSPFIFVLF